jgi:hypothetical protein
MAVGDVVHDLSDCLAAGTVRRVELRVGEATDGGAHAGGQLGDVL